MRRTWWKSSIYVLVGTMVAHAWNHRTSAWKLKVRASPLSRLEQPFLYCFSNAFDTFSFFLLLTVDLMITQLLKQAAFPLLSVSVSPHRCFLSNPAIQFTMSFSSSLLVYSSPDIFSTLLYMISKGWDCDATSQEIPKWLRQVQE